ncbi:MAG: hypothetical protein Q8N84_03790 [bacterium]|nr:hypothetical protein [bacterium]
MAIEGTDPPDDSLCEITIVAPGNKPWAETIRNTLKHKKITVGEGGLAQVTEASGVLITVPRFLLFTVVDLLDGLRVEWEAPLVRTPDAEATQDERDEDSA